MYSGNSATMRCAAQGFPAPQVLWQKDFGANFTAALEHRISKKYDIYDNDNTIVNSFVIQNIKAVDSGTYTCLANNPAGVISWNITLSVLQAPRYVSITICFLNKCFLKTFIYLSTFRYNM